MTVYKYILPVEDYLTLQLPRGAKPFCVAEQNGTACLWALVDPSAALVPHRFRVKGTGHPDVKASWSYVGTFFLLHGALVFHVFDLGEEA